MSVNTLSFMILFYFPYGVNIRIVGGFGKHHWAHIGSAASCLYTVVTDSDCLHIAPKNPKMIEDSLKFKKK